MIDPHIAFANHDDHPDEVAYKPMSCKTCADMEQPRVTGSGGVVAPVPDVFGQHFNDECIKCHEVKRGRIYDFKAPDGLTKLGEGFVCDPCAAAWEG